ncbi:putative leucine-rich repeat receptor-like protein kinase [Apostasia shenzhenica]|uniref:Putative leucine-rich repeat receptor-like protein kinase n=1 Tax=Apostasia shenzhenica TaxID=1088818 RepID=A0A2I0AAU0_9ASPA|nr:putative leucine-rich repeat receptor-like protein kinase [Apostasia shenzhenica]
MEKAATSLLAIPIFFLLLSTVNSALDDNVKLSLMAFLQKLARSNPTIDLDLNWTAAGDPCHGHWRGVSCDSRSTELRSVVLESLSLDGSIDPTYLSLLCQQSSSLSVISLKNNALAGNLPPAIDDCSQLTHLYLGSNDLSGQLPSSLSRLRNLKRLDVSQNSFSGEVPPELSRISGLITFLAENNRFNGTIPEFELDNFSQFNVSFNQFSGPLPLHSEKFTVSSFSGNPGLCGKPLPVTCPSPQPPPPPPPLLLPPPPSPPPQTQSKISGTNKTILVSGYVLFGLAVLLFVAHRILWRKKKSEKGGPASKEEAEKKVTNSGSKPFSRERSEYSISSSTSSSAAAAAASLTVLRREVGRELSFEELLRAPAELLGKGRYGSLYKVVVSGGAELAVKRIKDWTVSGEEFQRRMMKMDQRRHPNVLPVTAFYCSKQEKLVVYEFQRNGSLFNLLHDNKAGRPMEWPSRLNVAAGVSAGLAFMHRSLSGGVGAGHGNLKSSNVLFSRSMEPLISEYGLTALPTHRVDPAGSGAGSGDSFSPEADVYAFGVLLLELLTGKPSHGFDLAQWVNSVVREEWTVEVFDRTLLAGGGEVAEEVMVRLLQLALRCLNGSPEGRPAMAEVAEGIAGMKGEEDERPAASAA